MLRRDYSGRQIAAIEKAAVEEPALDITVRADPEDWREKLGGRLMGSGSIRLNDAGSVAELPGFKDGCWWVQDFSAALPVIALGCVEGRKVLDLCAAPGGKTAQLIAGKADVTALDVSAARLKTMEENLARLHMKAQKSLPPTLLSISATARNTTSCCLTPPARPTARCAAIRKSFIPAPSPTSAAAPAFSKNC